MTPCWTREFHPGIDSRILAAYDTGRFVRDESVRVIPACPLAAEMRITFPVTGTRVPQPAWAWCLAALWLLLVSLALLLAEVTGEELALCWFKRWFGVPCLTCGATRSTLNLLSGHGLTALAYNPLITVIHLLIVSWLTTRVLLKRAIRIEMTREQRWCGQLLLAAAVIANWIYVIQLGVPL